MRIGVISDTHGLVRPEALKALRGSRLIIHAGDIGSAAVLDELSKVAPVVAVRGNNDVEAWAETIPISQRVSVAGRALLVIHDRAELALDPIVAGLDVVISGHSHKPAAVRERGVLYFNPGSAGPRRFTLPITVGELRVARSGVEFALHELAIGEPTPAASRSGKKF